MDSSVLIPIIAIVVPFAFAAWVIQAGIRSKERKRGIRDSQQKEALRTTGSWKKD